MLLLTSAISLFAQSRKKDREKDSNVVVISKESIPFARQKMHTNIDGQILRLDKIDGKADGKIKLDLANYTNKELTQELLEQAKSLKKNIEKEPIHADPKLDNNIKLIYLKTLLENCKRVGDAMHSPKFNYADFKNIISAENGIIISTQKDNLISFLQENNDLGFYWNKNLVADNKQAYDIIINNCVQAHPAFFTNKLSEIQDYPAVNAVIIYMAKKNPLDVVKYATSTTPIGEIIKNSENSYVKGIYDLSKISTKAVNYLDEYVDGKISLEAIRKRINNKDEFYKSLVTLKQKNDVSTSTLVTRDLKVAVNDYVRNINELHDKPADIRFKAIANLNPTELYYLSVYGGDEIYTSSFLGVFQRFTQKLDKQTGFEFLESIQMDEFRTFVRMCANYNTLEAFLKTMETAKQKDLMNNFVSGLADGESLNLDGATEVADALGSINNEQLIADIEAQLSAELNRYKALGKSQASRVYYILKSLIASKTAAANTGEFTDKMSEELKIPSINSVPFSEFIDTASNTITEQMFFYGDSDGKDWYNRFVTSIKSSANWIITENNTNYLVLKAKNAKVPFTIFANKPLDEPNDEKAQDILAEYLITNNIAPSIVVHRGHSYHLPRTIESIFQLNKIVILGSCGGYHNLGTILEKSPDCHITSSKQVGKGAINVKIIDAVNNAIIKGKDIQWPELMQQIDKTIAPVDRNEWNDYVFPHKNLGALFLKAFKSTQ